MVVTTLPAAARSNATRSPRNPRDGSIGVGREALTYGDSTRHEDCPNSTAPIRPVPRLQQTAGSVERVAAGSVVWSFPRSHRERFADRSGFLCVDLHVPAARTAVRGERNLLFGLELYAAKKALTLSASMRPDTLCCPVTAKIRNVPLFHCFLASRTTKTGLGHWFLPLITPRSPSWRAECVLPS